MKLAPAADWVDGLVGYLTALPGLGAFGVALAAFFRAGRGIGRVEAGMASQVTRVDALESREQDTRKAEIDIESHADQIAKLAERVRAVEASHIALAVELAGVPKRDELHAMFAHAQQASLTAISDLRADIRELTRPR